jgi:hypothetical protein
MAKKKITQKNTYKKGVQITLIEELLNTINDNKGVYLINAAAYDDGTRSITVEIHYQE